MISIVIPNYNCSKYISCCLESVIAQSYIDWEIIIVDDSSTDNSLEIIQSYTERYENIRLIALVEHLGVSKARALGISASRGNYIAFLDADDYWDSQKLEKQVRLIYSESCDFVYSGARCVDDKNVLMNKVFQVPKSVTYEDAVKCNSIICSSVVIHRKYIESLNPADQKLHEDYYMWIQIMKNNQVKTMGINEGLVYYRIRKISRSRNKFKSVKRHYETLAACHVPVLKILGGIPAYIKHGMSRYWF